MKSTYRIALLTMIGAGALAAACVGKNTVPDAVAAPPAPVKVAANNPNLTKSETKSATATPNLLVGQDAIKSDWTTDKPGLRRLIKFHDLPKPFATPSVDNGAHLVPKPENAWPQAPEGFKVERMAENLRNPRVIVTAPNGDIFVAESGAGQVHILRDDNNDGKPEVNQVFATGFRQPFGIAFWPRVTPRWIFVANTDSVVRLPYRSGDVTARGQAETVISNVPGGGRLRGGGHWTRDIAFSNDGKKLYLSIGSMSNIDENHNPIENERARILEFNVSGEGVPDAGRVYATGIRNPVGLAVQPRTDVLWTSVNERDGMGDDLVPDYITSVADGGFYGWPWFYLGNHPDPRKVEDKSDLGPKTNAPDVLLQSHYASLALCFYTGSQFPKEYRGDIFAAEHGSWNRARRAGYKIIRVPLDKKGEATGEFEDFVTGFVTADGEVWGRPVGVTVAKDGALLFTDDGTNSVWRVVHENDKKKAKTASR